MTNDNAKLKKLSNSAFAGLGVRTDLAGEGYISWLRCSSDPQTETSPEGQKEVNDAYASVQQMRWAGYDLYAEAVSGSQTFNREDIAEIIRLKQTRNDFSKVIVFELGRATRGGIRHGNLVEDIFRKAGIELISSTELIPDGPIGELIKAVKHFGNQQQAHNISKAAARGLAQSLAKNQRPSANHTPFGFDRLYVGPDGQPRTLIRWEGMTQVRLDPKTGTEVSRATRKPPRPRRKKGERRDWQRHNLEKEKRFVGYKKQDDEISMLVEGADLARNAVISAWRKYYIENMGARRAVIALRAEGLRDPSGGNWSLSSFQNIVRNPIYLGIEVRHRWTKSLYHKLGPDGPIPVDVDQDKLQAEGKTSVPAIERPRDEWVLVDKPHLKDYLPPDVRAAGQAHIIKLLDTDTVVARQAKQGKREHKYDTNDNLLSHLMHSKQTGHFMRGDSKVKRRKNGEKVINRYYIDDSAEKKALSGAYIRRVRADLLEGAVLPVVFEALFDRQWVLDRIRAHTQQSDGGLSHLNDQKKRLEAERNEINRRLTRIHKTSGNLTDEELEPLVADDNARIVAIRQELRELELAHDQRLPTPEEAVAAVTERLTTLPVDWRSLPNREMKQFLAVVIGDMEIDLETFEVSLKLRLPRQAAEALEKPADDESRVKFTSAWLSLSDSTPHRAFQIAEIACERAQDATCFWCRRRKAA